MLQTVQKRENREFVSFSVRETAIDLHVGVVRTPAARDSWKKISITLKVSDFFWQDRTCNSTATRCNTSINIYGKSWDWEKSFDHQIARAQNTSLIWSHYFVPIELCQTSHDLGQELRLCDPPVPCPGAVQFQSDRFALFSNLGFSVNNVDSSTTGKTVSSTHFWNDFQTSGDPCFLFLLRLKKEWMRLCDYKNHWDRIRQLRNQDDPRYKLLFIKLRN